MSALRVGQGGGCARHGIFQGPRCPQCYPEGDTRPYKLTYEQAEADLQEWLARMDGAECFPGITEEMLDPMTLAWQEAYRVGRSGGTATP